MTKVFIDGREGTTGLKIYERLGARKDIEILAIPDEHRKEPAARQEYINKSDITFLCLPDESAKESVGLCQNAGTVIIDASTAHRTCPGWAYGFPELSQVHRNKIKDGKRIAVPGCHASGFISLAYPLVSENILPADYPLVCYSLTGYSGGGKKMIAEYESSDRSGLLDSPRQYGISQNHKHLKEMQHICGLSRAPIFSPIVADYPQGMEVSLPLYRDMRTGVDSARRLYEFFREYYRDQKMIEVLPYAGEGVLDRSFIASNMYSGDNRMYILIAGNDERILLCSLFDNLGKGASGAAVQCMNISLGMDEAYSLV